MNKKIGNKSNRAVLDAIWSIVAIYHQLMIGQHSARDVERERERERERVSIGLD